MIQFPFVEDYIEVIAGHKDATGFYRSGFVQYYKLISLARYDVSVIENMAYQIATSTAFTVRQAELACKIILKYERQLSSKGIDVSPVKTPKWRTPLREIDYSRCLKIQDDMLVIQFPYRTSLIEDLRKFSKESRGRCFWDKDARVWKADLTEYNLNWLYTWAKGFVFDSEPFEIDPEVHVLFEQILAVENQNYQIRLMFEGNKLLIQNCPTQLYDYVEKNLGGFNESNLLKLVDYSPILGYTLSDDISNAIVAEYGPSFYFLISNRELKLNANRPSQWHEFEQVLNYIDQCERWPAVFYEPDLNGHMADFLKQRYSSDLLNITTDYKYPRTENTRYIHAVKPVLDIASIPILVTAAAVSFGSQRQIMFQRAERVVFNVSQVYATNSTNKPRKVQNIAS
jgi:hypothetical protein